MRTIDIAALAAGLGGIQSSAERVEYPQEIIAVGLVNFFTSGAVATALAHRMATREREHLYLGRFRRHFSRATVRSCQCRGKGGLTRFAQALRICLAVYDAHVKIVSSYHIDTHPDARFQHQKRY